MNGIWIRVKWDNNWFVQKSWCHLIHRRNENQFELKVRLFVCPWCCLLWQTESARLGILTPASTWAPGVTPACWSDIPHKLTRKCRSHRCISPPCSPLSPASCHSWPSPCWCVSSCSCHQITSVDPLMPCAWVRLLWGLHYWHAQQHTPWRARASWESGSAMGRRRNSIVVCRHDSQ